MIYADAVKTRCTHFLPMHVPESPADTLRRLAEHPAAGAEADVYGAGGAVEMLERRCAELLGKPATRFFIKGMTAQQCVLAACADARGIRNVAIPRMSHLNLDEGDAIERVGGLRPIRLGGTGPFDLAALEAVKEPLAAVVVELPLRRAGFLLPPLEMLRGISGWCRDRGVPLHFDGARLWEAAAGYGVTLTDLTRLADSVYVSFYKGLGGLGGALVAGEPALIDAMAVWKQRHSGNLYTTYPYAISALDGLERQLPRMQEYVARARALAAALRDLPRVIVNPAEPHAHAFQLMARGDPVTFARRHQDFAERHQVWLFNGFQPAPLADHVLMEINIGDASDLWSIEQAKGWIADFLKDGGG
ncbi:beta-eliminating lyase-related protein [Stakelama sediminis]|uniref:Threonine aldolase n=1 Tax=Stakelama sediminis TaxID=463200 RepID=A0A840YUB4_9SPHN|nr:aminotransferase class I/II-fold pyridoxal phosphate-dependent enzyme [Stakelama sediminis]MBB5717160.1 threonine aldolase [Stakelama sediminis]